MRRLSVAAALGALLILPSAASAQSVTGTVVAPPATHGTHSVVPVLETDGSVVKLVVPARDAIRGRTGRLTAGQLRFGDAVRAAGRHLAGAKPHADRITVTARGKTQTFDAIAGTRTAAMSATQAAAGQAAQTSTAPDNAVQRAQLRAIRDVTEQAAQNLRAEADQLDATVGAASPVARAGSYLPALTATATAARGAADTLEDAVTKLDEAINDVGGQPPSVPVDSLPSDTFTAILDVLRALPGGVPRT